MVNPVLPNLLFNWKLLTESFPHIKMGGKKSRLVTYVENGSFRPFEIVLGKQNVYSNF